MDGLLVVDTLSFYPSLPRLSSLPSLSFTFLPAALPKECSSSCCKDESFTFTPLLALPLKLCQALDGPQGSAALLTPHRRMT
jgi:hypothetical protein